MSGILVKEHDEAAWLVGANGIFRIKDDMVTDYYHPVNALGIPAVITAYAMNPSNKEIWIGDNANGLVRVNYSDNKDGSLSFSTTSYVTTKEGLSDMAIRSLMWDSKGYLWIGTRIGGIFRMQLNKKIFWWKICRRALVCNAPAPRRSLKKKTMQPGLPPAMVFTGIHTHRVNGNTTPLPMAW